MTASMTSAAVRFWDALVAVAAISPLVLLLLPAPVLAAAPGARTYALTPLEEGRLGDPQLEQGEDRQPVIGYLRLTEDGWELDMLPGAVMRTGPLPVLTSTVDAAPEDATSLGVHPYAPLLRIDF
jgi:hypothetical protein